MNTEERKSTMPVLLAMVENGRAVGIDFSGTAFFLVQHFLLQTIELFDAMTQLKAKPENIFITGKYYSVEDGFNEQCEKMNVNFEQVKEIEWHESFNDKSSGDKNKTGRFSGFVSDRLTSFLDHVVKNTENIKQIMIIDDGGEAIVKIIDLKKNGEWNNVLKNIQIGAVEQTSDGANRIISKYPLPPFPIILVCSSAVKNRFEPRMIAEQAFDKIFKKTGIVGQKEEIKVAIIGYGSIAKALVDVLLKEKRADSGKFNIAICEHDPGRRGEAVESSSEVEWNSDLKQILNKSDYIIGCTGSGTFAAETDEDIAELLADCKGKKIFVSCSSGNSEFLPLIQYIYKRDPGYRKLLDDIQFKEIVVARGGHPKNFAEPGPGVDHDQIQTTVASLYGALLQIADVLKQDNNAFYFKLHANIQHFIVYEWLSVMRKVYRERKIELSEQDISLFNRERNLAGCQDIYDASSYKYDIKAPNEESSKTTYGYTPVDKYHSDSFLKTFAMQPENLYYRYKYGQMFKEHMPKYPDVVPNDSQRSQKEKIQGIGNVIPIVGASGIGKTVFAARMFYAEPFGYDYRFWFEASSVESLKAQYCSYAHLDVSSANSMRVISAISKLSNVLIIYDAIQDYNSIKDFIIPNKKEAITVVFTSNNAPPKNSKLAVNIDIHPVAKWDADKVKSEITRDNDVDLYINKLVDKLQNLAIAIDMAARFIVSSQGKTTVDKYIEEYDKIMKSEERPGLEIKDNRVMTSPVVMYPVCHLSVRKIMEINKLAYELLLFLASFNTNTSGASAIHPDIISFWLPNTYPAIEKQRVTRKLIDLLVEYSLIIKMENGRIRISHELVLMFLHKQYFNAISSGRRHAYMMGAFNVVANVYPWFKKTDDANIKKRQLESMAISLEGHFQSGEGSFLDKNSINYIVLLRIIIDILTSCRSLELAETYLNKLVDHSRQYFGKQSNEYIKARLKRGKAQRELNKAKEALATLEIEGELEQYASKKNQLKIRYYRALCCRDMSNLTDAKQMLEEAYKKYLEETELRKYSLGSKEKFKKIPSFYPRLFNNYGFTLQLCDNLDSAIKMYQSAYELEEKMLISQDDAFEKKRTRLIMAVTLSNIAIVKTRLNKEANDEITAIDSLIEDTPSLTPVFVRGLVTLYINMGNVYLNLGMKNNNERNKMLEISERKLLDAYEISSETKNNIPARARVRNLLYLAMNYSERRKFEESQQYFQQSLEFYKKAGLKDNALEAKIRIHSALTERAQGCISDVGLSNLEVGKKLRLDTYGEGHSAVKRAEQYISKH